MKVKEFLLKMINKIKEKLETSEETNKKEQKVTLTQTYKANREKYNDISIKKRGEGDEAGKCYKS